MLAGEQPFFRRIAPVAGVSLAFELLQYAFALGVSDITDLMGNTLGGVIGIALYEAVRWLRKTREKANRTFTVLAAAASACCTALLALLLLAN